VLLHTQGQTLEGKRTLVSDAGNVVQYNLKKLIDFDVRPVTCSDSSGYIDDEAGIDREKLDYLMKLKNVCRGRVKEYAEQRRVETVTAVMLIPCVSRWEMVLLRP